MEDKRIKIFIGIFIVSLLALYFGNLILTENQKVAVCVTASAQCDVFSEKQVHPANVNGANCIEHPILGRLCKPDYKIFQLSELIPSLKETCETNGHGTFSGWNTCTRAQGIYRFDPVNEVWFHI